MNEITPRLVQSIPSVDTDTRVPEIFRLSIESDRHRLQLLLEKNPQCTILDQIEGQLRDLLKLEHPARPLTEAEYQQGIEAKLAAAPREEYGVWVYYPWRNQLIHLLDEEEFIRVRTIRNAYKITFEEQAILRKKKVGVIGLSVGQSVSLALALERIAGEIRIADFDTLELSNLNRIRTGVHNLGVKKTTMVAREIAEIDPFIKVVCFDEGMTQGNIHEFVYGNGKLDIIAEECDSVPVKIAIRKFAREHRLPIVMDTSDRGLIDIERFDMEPTRELFHGMLPENFEELLKSPEGIRKLTMQIIEVNQVSQSGLASLSEIGKTITNWPQLATDVIFGGAVLAKLIEQILLGKKVPSGRKRLDVLNHYAGLTI
jgi:tRNA A37 threonylcarbamoyladenosine dehydratase